MIYLEYEQYKARYRFLQERFEKVLLEKEILFTRTLPNAIRYDRDQVQTSIDGNVLDDYVISLEEQKIDETLDHIRTSLKDWQILIDLKENELRKSKDKYDRVYLLRFIDGVGINRIAREMSYSRAQIYRILRQIERKIPKHETKCDK